MRSQISFHSVISIHALREEGNLLIITPQCCKGRISIHALREEGDLEWAMA